MARSYFQAQVIGYKRLNNSVNGNPKYKFLLYTPGETFELVTKSDAMFVYALVPETMLNEWFTVVIEGSQRKTIVDFGAPSA